MNKDKIKAFLQKYEPKIAIFAGFILIAAISFEFGLLQGEKWQNKPLVVEKPASSLTEPQVASASTSQGQNPASDEKIAPTSNNIPTAQCAFVGSKNSNKYHVPSCTFAKRIKPENLVCFSSIQDATAKGYQPDKSCIK